MTRRALIFVLAAACGAACKTAGDATAPPIVQPGAPGQPTRTIPAAAAADHSKITYTQADVRFMQGMIGHHAQALEMTALLPARTSREDMKLLARRIKESQYDEIRMMQRWLEVRNQDVPGAHAHHNDAPMMPGMLTQAEMTRLAEANGAPFDRLFLELMIKHHEGALVMVKDLFSRPGAGQDPEIFAFASDVEADQRMEIERMGALLKELEK